MKYRPGSFSKNFGWKGAGLRGLRKLYNAVRAGFAGSLAPVPREQWRANSGIGDRALELIPVNFFLHNARGRISVDELVFQSATRPHSIEFDRLALFALHLNRVGKPPGGIERPAMWANTFVRELLWREGAWQSAALTEAVLDPFIADHLEATPRSKEKCRTNYRFLFEACGHLPTRLPIINTGADHWLRSALFLAWDRLVLNHGTQPKSALIRYSRDEELHKLVGVPKRGFDSQVSSFAELYLAAGALDRFSAGAPTPVVPELAEEAGTEWIEQDEIAETVGRRLQQVKAQQRDRRKAAALRKHYDNTCVICGTRLQVGRDKFYAEAAHIKPLGKPHNGPDIAKNMLVLCPNHHLQFDSGMLCFEKTGEELRVVSRATGDPVHGKVLTLRHTLDDEYVGWHRDWMTSLGR
jgi:predicted HNH restriction endonuclease